jgi:hypothetical protein
MLRHAHSTSPCIAVQQQLPVVAYHKHTADLIAGFLVHERYGIRMQQHTITLLLQLSDEGAADDDEGEDGVPSYREWILPAQDFHGLWESLYFDSSIKRRLMKYAASALLFADHRVNSQLISWNRWAGSGLEHRSSMLHQRPCLVTPTLTLVLDIWLIVCAPCRVVLRHGPPGTGKTSLCKALAQKLTIRFSKR